VDAHDLLARHGEQPERVVLAQVGLGREGQPREIVERGDLSRVGDARGVQALAHRRDIGEQAGHGRTQAFELQRGELVAGDREVGERHAGEPSAPAPLRVVYQ
jgi:hypothetical protein